MTPFAYRVFQNTLIQRARLKQYVRHTVGTYTAKQLPQQEIALKAVREVLTDLELRVIEFLSEWIVALLMPAKHVLDTRSPHLAFMLVKEFFSVQRLLAFTRSFHTFSCMLHRTGKLTN